VDQTESNDVAEVRRDPAMIELAEGKQGMMITIREAFVKASSFLAAKGIEEPAFIAELLLRHVLGWERAEYLLRWNEPLPEALRDRWLDVLARKAAGEPAQYIIGEQAFYGLPFAVTPAVLIPRPETELLVEVLAAEGRRLWPDGAPSLVDVGTGSGAIAVTLATLCPKWRIAASDISPAALGVARANAQRNGVAERIAFHEGDLLGPFLARAGAPAAQGGGFDIVVSNPPYIPTLDIAGLQPEVRLHEPMSALDGGADGLDLYRRLVGQLPQLASMPRLVGFEVGIGQAQDVAAMLRELGYTTRIVLDYAGIERHVIGMKE